MSSAEFTQWQAFDRIEPWGGLRFQIALLNATLANIYRKKGGKTFDAEDFLPVERRQSPAEIFRAFEIAFAARPQDQASRREQIQNEGLHLGSVLPDHLQPHL